MTDLEHARTRFKAISEGHYVPKEISVEEAKERLRAADPALDISDMLKALHREEDLQKAAAAALLETLTHPAVISYWSPVLIGLFQALMPAGKPASSPTTEASGEK